MTYGVGNNSELIPVADFGGQRLLGIKSLTDYINNGTTLPQNIIQQDTFNSHIVQDNNTSGKKLSKILSALTVLITGGVGIAYIVKTGKIKPIINNLGKIARDVGRSFAEICSDIWKKIFKKGI